MTDINYSEAARRHFRDAELLEKSGYDPNADQLYGMAAECALLGILVSLPEGGRLVDDNGYINKPTLKRHINGLWREALSFFQGHRGGVYYTRLYSQFRRNPFYDWSTDQRYYSDAALGRVNLRAHGAAAKKCLEVMELAEQNALGRH